MLWMMNEQMHSLVMKIKMMVWERKKVLKDEWKLQCLERMGVVMPVEDDEEVKDELKKEEEKGFRKQREVDSSHLASMIDKP